MSLERFLHDSILPMNQTSCMCKLQEEGFRLDLNSANSWHWWFKNKKLPDMVRHRQKPHLLGSCMPGASDGVADLLRTCLHPHI